MKKDLRVEITDALEGKIRIERRIHQGWVEWNNLPKKKGMKQIFGKYQYTYKSPKGMISLVLLKYYDKNKNLWEIYELGGKLFSDVERFNTKKEAEVRIRRLLE